jgi:hypothetical protein
MASNNANPAGGEPRAQVKFSGPRLIEEIRYTRDEKVPVVEGDEDLDYGWHSIPVRPAVDDDWQSWEIFDESKDYKTGWRRWHLVEGTA